MNILLNNSNPKKTADFIKEIQKLTEEYSINIIPKEIMENMLMRKSIFFLYLLKRSIKPIRDENAIPNLNISIIDARIAGYSTLVRNLTENMLNLFEKAGYYVDINPCKKKVHTIHLK